jgi:Na+/proline symporter
LLILYLYWHRMTKQAAWVGLSFGTFTAIVGCVAMAAGVLPEWADPVLPTLVGTALFIITVTLKMQPNAETMAVYERLKRCVETGGASSPSGVPEMQRRTP